MNQIGHRTSAIASKRPDAEYTPASGDIRALIEAKREGYLWRTDLTPDRVASVASNSQQPKWLLFRARCLA